MENIASIELTELEQVELLAFLKANNFGNQKIIEQIESKSIFYEVTKDLLALREKYETFVRRVDESFVDNAFKMLRRIIVENYGKELGKYLQGQAWDFREALQDDTRNNAEFIKYFDEFWDKWLPNVKNPYSR